MSAGMMARQFRSPLNEILIRLQTAARRTNYLFPGFSRSICSANSWMQCRAQRRFRYDAKHDILKCPRGLVLRPARPYKHGRFFYSKARDFAQCPLRPQCLSKGRVNKAIVLSHDYPALLRAHRRRKRWTEEDWRLYQRHRWRSEGFHGEAKTWHGLARAVRRGLANMKIQAYLTAAAINLKRLAAALLALLLRWLVPSIPFAVLSLRRSAGSRFIHPGALPRMATQKLEPPKIRVRFTTTARLCLDRPEHGGSLVRIGTGKTPKLAPPSVLRRDWNLPAPAIIVVARG